MTNITKVLLALTVFMVVVLAVKLQEGESKAEGIGSRVFPELKGRINEVDQLRLRSTSQEAVITQEEGIWTVEERGGYPADFTRLSEFLNGIANANYLEKKTARADNHQQLGLLSADQQESTAVAVMVSSDEDKIAEILLGNSSAHMEGSYFRFPGQDQVWLMDKDLDISADPATWLKHIIVDVPERDVEQVHQSPYGADSFTLSREHDEEEYGNFLIKDLPAGKKLIYPTIANEMGRALVNLRLKDVVTNDEFDWSTANRTDFTCKNNLQLVVWSLQLDDRYYLRFSAQPRDRESDDARVRELSSRLQPWVYEVSKMTYQQFSKQLSDFLVENTDDVKDT